MIKIYHNPRCKKSRAGLAYLEATPLDFEVIDYLKNPLTKAELKALIQKTALPASELIRTQEEVFKQHYKGKNLSNDAWLEAIVAHPKLLKRPIVEVGDRALWADPAENINQLLPLKK